MKRYFILVMFVASLFCSCENDGEGQVTIDPATYVKVLDANAEVFHIMTGVVADGHSQVEFALPCDEENKITSFSVEELSEKWGTFGELSEPILKNNLNAYRVTLTSSESLPAAVKEGLGAQLNYLFKVTTEDGVTTDYPASIVVVRPPVLFVHGLWSAASTYDPILSVIKPKELYLENGLYAVDYSATASESYATNKDVVPNGIAYLRKEMFREGIVCDRVSVVGHSMGGILTRMYMQGRSSMRFRDDIHKLICIDTPHSGSQLADFAIALGAKNPDGAVAKIAAMGAIVDLAVASDATAELNSVKNLTVENGLDIPTHLLTAHIGTAADVAELVKEDAVLGAVITAAINAIEKNKLYNGDSSDIVVPTESQKGGVKSGIRDNFISVYNNKWHCSILTSPEVAEELVTLLDAPTTGSDFTTDGFDPALLTFNSESLDGVE